MKDLEKNAERWVRRYRGNRAEGTGRGSRNRLENPCCFEERGDRGLGEQAQNSPGLLAEGSCRRHLNPVQPLCCVPGLPFCSHGKSKIMLLKRST